MKSFITACLVSVAVAQFTGSTADIDGAFKKESFNFSGKATSGTSSMNALLYVSTMADGSSYLTWDLTLKGPTSSFFGTGAQQLMYLQMDKPTSTAGRLLSGTEWEGWYGVANLKAGVTPAFTVNQNIRGTEDATGNKAHFLTTGWMSKSKVEPGWQLADSASQTYAVAGTTGTWNARVWRAATGTGSEWSYKLGVN